MLRKLKEPRERETTWIVGCRGKHDTNHVPETVSSRVPAGLRFGKLRVTVS